MLSLEGETFGQNRKDRMLVWAIRSLGHYALHLSVLQKRILASRGQYGQRIIEYPWALKMIGQLLASGAVNLGSRVLDVGVAESVFHYELLHKGFDVSGIDIRWSPIIHPRIHFVQRPLQDTQFPNDYFDLAVVISTIEHIGLLSYDQTSLDYDADFRCIEEIHRILRKGGHLILTTPFDGRSAYHITRSGFERHYDVERLTRLLAGSRFLWVVEDYFLYDDLPSSPRYLHYERHTLPWHATISQEHHPGLACIVAKKI